MKIAEFARRIGSLGGLFAALFCISQSGCITGATRAIPATRLPDIYKSEPKCEQVPVNLDLHAANRGYRDRDSLIQALLREYYYST